MSILLVPNPWTVKHVPLGLLAVASSLRKHGTKAEILDLNRVSRDLDTQTLADEILRRSPRVVGFSVMASQFPRVLATARRIKRARREIKVILGGPDPTLKAASTLEHYPEIDIVVRGECEQTIFTLAQALARSESLQDIPGVCFRESGSVKNTLSAPLLTNLDRLPLPDYGLLESIDIFGEDAHLPIEIEAGRGCPFGCSFCCLTSLLQRK